MGRGGGEREGGEEEREKGGGGEREGGEEEREKEGRRRERRREGIFVPFGVSING